MSERADDPASKLAHVRELLAANRHEEALSALAQLDPEQNSEVKQLEAEALLLHLTATARSEGYDPADYARTLLNQQAGQAFDLAQTDPLAGAKAMGEILDALERFQRSPGIEQLASFAAALGYNRAAALRRGGQIAQASRVFSRTVEVHLHDETEPVRVWVALALINHAQMLAEIESSASDPRLVEKILELVDQLITGFADSAHPVISVRVARAALLKITLLLDANRVEDASRAYDDLGFAFNRDPELRSTFEELGLIVAVEASGPVDEAVLQILTADEETLAAAEEFAQQPKRLEILFTHPALATGRLEQILTKRGERAAWQERRRLRKVTSALRRAREKLEENPTLWELQAEAPLEELIGNVNLAVAAETAINLAARPPVVAALSKPYVHALCREATAHVAAGDWRTALVTLRVVRRAVSRLPPSDLAFELSHLTGIGFLRAAERAYAQVGDPVLLSEARQIFEAVAADAESRREPVMASAARVAFASVLIAPYIRPGNSLDDPYYFAGIRRWMDRLSEEVPDLSNKDPDADQPSLSIVESLDEAERLLHECLPAVTGGRAGTVLWALVEIELIRSRFGDLDRETTIKLIERAYPILATDLSDNPYRILRIMLAYLACGGTVDRSQVDVVVAQPRAVLQRNNDAFALSAMLLAGCQLLLRLDPDAGLELLDRFRDVVDGATEETRIFALLWEWRLLRKPRRTLPEAVQSNDRLPQALSRIRTQAVQERWSRDDLNRAILLAIEVRESKIDDEQIADMAFTLWGECAAALSRPPGHAFAVGMNVWFSQLAQDALDRQAWVSAARWYMTACGVSLELDAPDSALESLTLVDYACSQPLEAGAARALLEKILPIALRIDRRLGPRATPIMQRVVQHLVKAELSMPDSIDLDALVGLFQVAKGLRFGTSLTAAKEYDWRNDRDAEPLINYISSGLAHERVLENLALESPDSTTLVDLVSLVSPYEDNLDPLTVASRRDLTENLQRTFEKHVQGQLDVGDPAFTPLWLADLLATLDDDAVLLLLYRGLEPGGKPAVIYMMLTSDQPTVIGYQPVAESAKATLVRVGDRPRVLDDFANRILNVREIVQDDPPRRFPATPEALQVLDQALEFLIGPGTARLQALAEGGKRRLAISPFGPLHFFPFGLIHLAGKPLADHFAVTTLPNLAMLRRSTRLSGTADLTVASIGVDFVDASPFDLPVIREAAEEASAVSALFGTVPILSASATETKIRDALENNRIVHIATHGRHDVAAPGFQCLYAVPDGTSDGELRAYELLSLDLGGLDLCTLSACETSLGRFDASDNLRGMPASLLLRGVGALIGTLWMVETTVSRDFFVELYKAIRSGTEYVDAFAEAQRVVRRQHPQYRDWGAFQYVGDWR